MDATSTICKTGQTEACYHMGIRTNLSEKGCSQSHTTESEDQDKNQKTKVLQRGNEETTFLNSLCSVLGTKVLIWGKNSKLFKQFALKKIQLLQNPCHQKVYLHCIFPFKTESISIQRQTIINFKYQLFPNGTKTPITASRVL